MQDYLVGGHNWVTAVPIPVVEFVCGEGPVPACIRIQVAAP